MRGDIIIVGVCLLMVCQSITALPANRVKRGSHQRLAELETLIGFSKMAGIWVPVPLGLGKVDPVYIGKRRRRSDSRMLSSLESRPFKEDVGDPVENNFPSD